MEKWLERREQELSSISAKIEKFFESPSFASDLSLLQLLVISGQNITEINA